MSFLKLDEKHQMIADNLYKLEKEILLYITTLESPTEFGKHRWLSIGKTHIEQGFMALRKAVTEHYRVETSTPGYKTIDISPVEDLNV